METVVRGVLEKLHAMEQELGELKGKLQITDKQAKSLITEMIEKCKASGKREIDVIEIHHEIRLPVTQISRVLGQLEREGKVRQDE